MKSGLAHDSAQLAVGQTKVLAKFRALQVGEFGLHLAQILGHGHIDYDSAKIS